MLRYRFECLFSDCEQEHALDRRCISTSSSTRLYAHSPEGESNVMLRSRLECSFSTTLLPGEPLSEIMRFSVKSTAASIPKVDGVAGWVAATNAVGPARNSSIKGPIYTKGRVILEILT